MIRIDFWDGDFINVDCPYIDALVAWSAAPILRFRHENKEMAVTSKSIMRITSDDGEWSRTPTIPSWTAKTDLPKTVGF